MPERRLAVNLVKEVEVAMESRSSIPKSEISARQLESVYRHYGSRVYLLCLRLIADAIKAESATVDVFVQFGRTQSGLWDESRALLCLGELAIDAALTHLRAPDGHKRATAPVPQSSSNNDGRRAAERLEPELLDALIVRLPDVERIAFVLHDVEGVGDASIAIHLRMSETETRRYRSKARLELLRLWRGQQISRR